MVHLNRRSGLFEGAPVLPSVHILSKALLCLMGLCLGITEYDCFGDRQYSGMHHEETQGGESSPFITGDCGQLVDQL